MEEIADNGKKWMGEEVMVAFRNYIEGKPDLAVRISVFAHV